MDELATLTEHELGAYAASVTARLSTDPRLVRLGVVVFWSVVLCLLAARALFLDSAALQPKTSVAQSPPAMSEQLAGNAAVAIVYGRL